MKIVILIPDESLHFLGFPNVQKCGYTTSALLSVAQNDTPKLNQHDKYKYCKNRKISLKVINLGRL